MSRLRVSVIGAGSCSAEAAGRAEALGRLLARAGFDVVCGGLGGVMLAACKGAREAGADVFGILPGEDRSRANEHVTHALATGLGPMRNYLVVLNGDVAVAVEGGAGTLSEIGLALKSGRKVVALGRFKDLEGVIPADGPEDAVRIVKSILGE